jgi:hypothetical protein
MKMKMEMINIICLELRETIVSYVGKTMGEQPSYLMSSLIALREAVSIVRCTPCTDLATLHTCKPVEAESETLSADPERAMTLDDARFEANSATRSRIAPAIVLLPFCPVLQGF